MQHKKILLASLANVAQSIKQIQKTATTFQTDNVLKGVARAEDQILLMEAEVQAGSQFSNPLVKFDSAYINEEELNSEIEKLKNEKVVQA